MSRRFYFTSKKFQNTIAVLERCKIFAGVSEAISLAINSCEILMVKSGEAIIEQNSRDKSIFVILEGAFDILVNGRGVATRNASEILGEMSIVDPSAKRSATVLALEDSVVFKMNDDAFICMADSNPRIWRNIAAEISERLRQRGELVDVKENEPRLFIGSSGEFIDVAYAIQKGLMRTDIIVNVWSQDCFRPSSGTLLSLEDEATRCDFALFLFGNEDLTTSRGEESESPRDNVVFELGLFMGRLSTKRVFFAKEIDINLKIPSDLLGITPIEYRRKPAENLSISVQPIVNEISRITKELGTK